MSQAISSELILVSHFITLSHCARMYERVCEYLNSCMPTAKRSAQDKAKERHEEDEQQEEEEEEVVERSIREIRAIIIKDQIKKWNNKSCTRLNSLQRDS